MKRVHLIAWLLGLLPLASTSLAADAPAGPNTVQLEALKRLQGVDLETNPSLKAAVLKIVDTTRGTPQFVELVEQFKLKNQSEGLLQIALQYPATEAGVRAIRLVHDAGDVALIKAALEGSETNALACLQALGNTKLSAMNTLLQPVLGNESASDALRREAVRALAKNEPGAQHLLKLAKADQLPEAVKLTAATALSQVEWPAVRAEASELLPLPKAGGDETLPPITELAKRSGDPARGAQIFSRDTTACNRCHQVGGQGVNIGPDLTLIGDKLGKDALLEAILDPNNGIAFGFEAWTVTTKSDEEVYGLVISETAEEVAVKDLSGIVHRIAKPVITSRTQSKFSLMPTGLQASMTVTELVDLIEYLSRLKKPAAN